jgi:hypothetical protein
MDSMQRRAVFAASVQSQLRRVGIDLYKDVLSQNKEIPTSIIKSAVEESFKDTLSYTPQMYTKSFSAFEDLSEKVGSMFVKGIEAVPGLSIPVPFPRFITNAIAFQYKYSIFGFIGASEYAIQARTLRLAGKLDKAEQVAREGATKAVQAVVGIGVLAAAYDYRKNNPHLKWNEVEVSNGILDVRAIFPVAPVFAAADWLARDVFGGTGSAPKREITESILGFKMPAGTQNTVLQTIQDLFESDETGKKFLENLGKVSGDFLGRFTQPFVTKQIFDMFDLIRGDEAVMARDPNVLTAETTTGRVAEAAVQRVQAKLPVVKEQLPAAVPRFKEEPPKKQGEEQEQATISKEGEFFNRLVGFRTAAPRTEAEKEIVKHSTDLYKVYGRPSGEKDFDREFIVRTNRYALQRVNNVIKDRGYDDLLSEQKKKLIDDAIARSVEDAKSETENFFIANYPEKMRRIEYLRLSSEDRKIVNKLYALDHGGKTMEEDKAYSQLPIYVQRAKVKYAKGGMVQQMTSLFGKHSWA